MKSNPSVYWALLMVSLLYGLNYIIAKDVMPLYLSSSTFIALRLFVCTILFWIIGIFFKKERIHTNDIPLIIFCAFLGAAFNQLTFFKGLSLTTPINAALLMILVPILVFLFSTFFGKEKWIGINLLGIILGFVGAFLIIASNSKGGVFNIHFSKGDFFIFLNALSFALYLVFSKPLIGKYSPLFLMKWFFLIAFFMVLPFAYSGLFTTEWQIIPNIIWIKIAYLLHSVIFIRVCCSVDNRGQTVIDKFQLSIYLRPRYVKCQPGNGQQYPQLLDVRNLQWHAHPPLSS